jgi:hypothetical protein
VSSNHIKGDNEMNKNTIVQKCETLMLSLNNVNYLQESFKNLGRILKLVPFYPKNVFE